jgi:hypothetical protein
MSTPVHCACAGPCKRFSALLPACLCNTPAPPFVYWSSHPGRTQEQVSELIPRRTTCARPEGHTAQGLASPGRLLLPRRSATRLAPPGPGGPRFARRCAQRPRWSRLPGGGADVGHVTSAPPAPEGPRWVSGRPLVLCDHGVTTKGDAQQLCSLVSGRGRARASRCDLVIELVWHSVNCPRAKQVLAEPRGRVG